MIKEPDYKITHIGPFPPPLGGISVYFYRLSRIYREYDFIDEKKLSKLKMITLFFGRRRHFVYHIAIPSHAVKHALLWLVSRHKFSIIIHGQLQYIYEQNTPFTQFWIRRVLALSEHISVVNPDSREFIINVLKVSPDKIIVQSPFLPPPLEEEDKILRTYDEKTIAFIKAHKPLIVVNASRVVFYKGVDIYGLHISVGLISRLKSDYPDVGILFALAEIGERAYYERINREIDALGIRDNIFFMTGQKELWPLFKKADLMIRPTATDGDAVSIREALYFHCPACGTDVCSRPEGTVLFKNGDAEDLYGKVLAILKRGAQSK